MHNTDAQYYNLRLLGFGKPGNPEFYSRSFRSSELKVREVTIPGSFLEF